MRGQVCPRAKWIQPPRLATALVITLNSQLAIQTLQTTTPFTYCVSPEITAIRPLMISRIQSLHQLLRLPRHVECERRQLFGEFLELRAILDAVAFDAGIHQAGTGGGEDLHNGISAILDRRVLAALRGVFGFPHDFADDDGDVIEMFLDGSRTIIGSDAADKGLDRL